jgi:hypothetical protein
VFVAIGLIAGALAVDAKLQRTDLRDDDIYYSWVEGERILRGVNPYERVLGGDMRVNDKYATYFPGFYLLSAGLQASGWQDFQSWVGFWRPVFLSCMIGIGIALWLGLSAWGAPILGLGAMAFWLFNRWTLAVSSVVHLDFPPLLFLVLALLVWRRNQYWAAFCFSISLALKQIALFVAPLLLVWAWLDAPPGHRLRRTLGVFLCASVLPILLSVPFLAWNAEGYAKSVLFSATRVEGGHFPAAPALDLVLGWDGALNRAPFYLFVAFVYVAASKRTLTRETAAALVMVAFTGFNRTLFYQYMVWPIPLVLLALGARYKPEDHPTSGTSTGPDAPSTAPIGGSR